MKAILYIFIVKPLLSRPLEILRYYTIPSMAFCNLSSILIINYYEDLDNAKYLYACTLVWIAIEVLALTTCYTALASFFASKADDLIGGTYMAVLWTSEYSFFFVESFHSIVSNSSNTIGEWVMTRLTGVFDDYPIISSFSGYQHVAVARLVIFKGITVDFQSQQ